MAFRRFFIAVLFGTWALTSSITSADSLDLALTNLAREIKEFIDDHGGDKTKVSIGRIQGPPRSGGSRAIEVLLKEKLKAIDFVVVPTAEAHLELRGRFANQQLIDQTVVAIEVEFVDSATGARVKGLLERYAEASSKSRIDAVDEVNKSNASEATKQEAIDSIEKVQGAIVDNATDIATVNGVTADLASSVKAATGIDGTARSTPGTPPPAINNDLRSLGKSAVDQTINAAIKQPSFHSASATAIAASAASPFRIQIEATDSSDEDPYSPVSVQSINGLAFVSLVEGQRYQVRVFNDADFDVGLELSIDGINSLALSEIPDFKRLGKWVIPARSSGLVRGWLINNQRIDEFVVTAEPQGVAAILGRTQSIGMVTATFFPAWEGDAIPPFQKLLAGEYRVGATGQGKPLQANVRNVLRNFGTEPLSIITVRYNNPEPPVDLPNQ